ncbi:hypothetical protein ZWY2020_006477 [Hordeum vulgare]|nr:hypothetical protein ZWY2020_006477 [Hordeum vulgare]
MALRLHHLPLLLLLTALLPTASATHSPESATSYSHHHYPTGTATAHFHPVHGAAPSMHQNHLETESQPLLAVEPAVADAQTTARPPLLVPVPPQAAAPSPPPTSVARPDLAASRSEATPQPREGSATATATTLPNQSTLPSPPPPVQAGAAAGEVVISDSEQGLHQLSRALASLGYQEMAAAAGALLVNSPLFAKWPGPMTVFAAPDAFLQASCPTCSRRDLLIHHIAMGYYPYSELAAAAMVKIPSASVNFCINIVSEGGPFDTGLARIYADDVEVSHPDLYNDGLYVVHGLVGFLRPLTHSCFDGPHPHHRRSLAGRSSGGTLVREAIARLRRRGFGVVAIALRLQFTELQRFANLTVFALEDQAIFARGGHDYVSSVRFHIVLKHRLTRAELLRLRPGTILPTLAGEDQSLVITHGAGENVFVNYIHIKESDVVVNSRIAVHGIESPLLHLNGELHSGGAAEPNLKKRFTLHDSQRPAEQGWARDRGVPLYWAVVGAAVAAMAGVAGAGSWFRWVKGKDGKRIYLAQAAMEATYNTKYGRRDLMAELEEQKKRLCAICSDEAFDWTATCCDVKFCCLCLGTAYVKRHNALYAPGPCVREGSLLPSLRVKLHPDLPGMYMESETRKQSSRKRLTRRMFMMSS